MNDPWAPVWVLTVLRGGRHRRVLHGRESDVVTGTPERLSLPVLSALCAIFGVAPSDLITTEAFPVGVRSTATGDLPGSAKLGELRPSAPASSTRSDHPARPSRAGLRAMPPPGVQ